MPGLGEFLLGPEGQSLLRTLQFNGNDKPNPYAAAQQEALDKYPFLQRLGAPIVLTQGKGPFESESYMPQSSDNPQPGNYTVQLRNKDLINDPSRWSGILGREGLDWVARQDPVYQSAAQAFKDSMSDEQRKTSRARYDRLQKTFGDMGTFDDFLKDSEIQEYMGGYLFSDVIPGWTGEKGKGQYTPEQERMMDSLKDYLMKPNPEIRNPPFWERQAMDIGEIARRDAEKLGSRTFAQNYGDFFYNAMPKSNLDAAIDVAMLPAIGKMSVIEAENLPMKVWDPLTNIDDTALSVVALHRLAKYLSRDSDAK
jgi:hypothetical protein